MISVSRDGRTYPFLEKMLHTDFFCRRRVNFKTTYLVCSVGNINLASLLIIQYRLLFHRLWLRLCFYVRKSSYLLKTCILNCTTSSYRWVYRNLRCLQRILLISCVKLLTVLSGMITINKTLHRFN